MQITVAPEALQNAKGKASSRARPVTIRAAQAVFEQEGKKLSFTGGVTTEQDRDLLSGDSLYAVLTDKKQVQKVEIRGNCLFALVCRKGAAPKLRSADMDFYFDKDQQIEKGYAMRDASAKTLDADSDLNLDWRELIEVLFQPRASAA